jgi:hypothetical protein
MEDSRGNYSVVLVSKNESQCTVYLFSFYGEMNGRVLGTPPDYSDCETRKKKYFQLSPFLSDSLVVPPNMRKITSRRINGVLIAMRS